MANPKVSIIIVNYRVKYFLTQTLYSVEEAFASIPHEVFVVDNNSGDDSIEYVRSHFPSFTYIENSNNVGFAKANNQAIKEASGEYCLILNPDTIITTNAIEAALNYMEKNEKCGGIGTKMIDGNGKFLPESKRSFPTPWVSFCKIFGLSKIFPKSPLFARYHLRYLSEDEIHEIDILSGAYMFIRTDLLKQLGGFDETFFMYGEDIDLSYRITKAGYTNNYLPTPIIHYKGECTKKDSIKYVQIFYDAMLIFFRKHFPHYSSAYYLFVKTGVIIRAAIAILKRIVKRVFGFFIGTPDNSQSKWLIISNSPSDIYSTIESQFGLIAKSTAGHMPKVISATDIVLDDRTMTYGEIVDTIHSYNDTDLRFHIYSGKCKTLITPKMIL